MIEAKFMSVVEVQMQDIATGMIENPFQPENQKMFSAGRYAGLKEALQILESLIEDRDAR